MQTWRTVHRSVLLRMGPYLTVEDHTVALPDGRLIHNWPWIITPDYVNVVLVTPEERFLCFRQTKYAVSGASLAIVGGYLEEGEAPLAAAKREALEETGHQAAAWISLGHFPVDGNRGAGTCHLYLATGARQVAEIHADDLEDQELLWLDRTELRAALNQGEFKVLPWSAAVALALLHLDNPHGRLPRDAS